MKIYSTIYYSKAYYCILKNIDSFIYDIYSCDGDQIKRSRTRSDFESALKEIQSFYESLDLKIPKEEDFVPYKVWIRNISNGGMFVKYNAEENYSIIVGRGSDDDRHYTLIENLNYSQALDKSNQLSNLLG